MRTNNQNQKTNFIQRAAWIFAALAFIYYAISLVWYAVTQVSVLDEGLYLFKGWLFSSGAYTPFQENGPWTNQMPFAFYIPGWLQQFFSPGLLTGRVVAIIQGLLTFFGLGLTLRKFADDLVVAGLLILFALNSAQTKMISVATSQGLISFLLVWMFYLLFGYRQKAWALFTAGIIAGLSVMVRINLVPILPIILGYVYWDRGFKPMLLVGMGIAIIFFGTHLYFWPEILQIWAKWLPFPFLSGWAAPKTVPTWQPDTPFAFRVASFFLAFRFHFVALVGSIISISLVSFKKLIESSLFKSFWFLIVIITSLFFIHMWAALFNDYCIFCFPTYVSFFEIIGYILIALVFPYIDLSSSKRAGIGLLSCILILAGIAYSAEDIYLTVFEDTLYRGILNLTLPFTGAELWQIFANKFNLEYPALIKVTNSIFPILISLFVLFGMVGLVVVVHRWGKGVYRGIASHALVLIGFFAAFLTPSNLFAGGYNTYDCEFPVVDRYDMIGEQISALIPEGAQLYWAGYSPVTLLHLREVKIYPSQLHSGYSYRISGDNEGLLKYGWWNENLARMWAKDSDYILLEAKNLEEMESLTNNFQDHKLIYRSQPQNCRPNSEMLLFRRNQ